MTLNRYKYIWVFVGWDLIETVMWYIFGWVGSNHRIEQRE